MKTITKRLFAVAGVLALGLTAVKAQTDGALLDALVQKGVLSDQEAEDIRASAAKDYATTPAGKLSISDHITQLKLYGDARMRYEYIDENPQNKAFNALDPNATGTDRYRYRIRIGADYTFTDNFKAGFELESATAGDSANQSFGNGFSKYPINVGLLYLQWKPTDWLTLVGGKQRNPLYTTGLVWDPDINPEGGSEIASWTFPVDFGSSAPASTDPKAVVAPPEPSTMSLTIGLTAGQYIYADNSEGSGDSIATNGNGNSITDNTDVWLFAEQVPIQFNFDKDTFVKEVPGFLTYMGGGNTNISASQGSPGSNNGTASFGAGTAIPYSNVHAADDLAIITAPGEFDWKLWDLPFKAYWDFALNLDGKSRVQNVYLFPDGGSVTNSWRNQNQGLGDNIAWLAGLQVGQNKKKGDWSIQGDFRQIGLGAVDPNINDSDFADSYLNQQGVRIQSQYNFTDFLTGSITYFNTWNYKSNLFDSSPALTPGASGNTAANPNAAATYALAPANATQRVQVDLMWKF
jgi:hypothetical protein